MLTGLVEDVTTYAPEFAEMPIVTRMGTTYKVATRTALPPVQFRIPNQGVTPGKSSFKQEVKEMFFLDGIIQVDEAVVKGDDRSTGDILSHEAQGTLQNAILTIGNQTWYGLDADANGFKGVRAQISGTVPAKGTTNTTSAYLVWRNPWGAHYDVGNDGAIALPPPMRQLIADPNNTGKNLFAWVTNLSTYIGFSCASAYSLWAVTGIDPATATWPVVGTLGNCMTDGLAAQLMVKVPLNRRNGLVWFMNRNCHGRLQTSRSALGYQPAGAENATPAWSPPPTQCEGFDIIVTDSILDTENNT
jgi:hypothetical protein